MAHAFTVAAAALLAVANAGYNKAAMTPPMGWRSWNQMGCNVSQQTMITAALGLTDTSRMGINGQPVSLLQLGYNTVGLDDCWQQCGSNGPNGYTFHDANGRPIVDRSLFPDLLNATTFIHSLGLGAGWYGNNCHCSDHCNSTDCFRGDVNALLDFGFDAVKYDGCGHQKNMSLWGSLLANTAIADTVVIENCGNDNKPAPNADLFSVPFHLYRISTDIRPTYGSTMNNAQNSKTYIQQNNTGPGCWAYPDMLEVGVTNNNVHSHGPRAGRYGQLPGAPAITDGPLPPVLSLVEARSHFSLWCILSAPLTLSMDFTDTATVDAVWPIITNSEAIAVNQAWAGLPLASTQGVIYESPDTVLLEHCDWNWAGDHNCTLPVIQQWYKPLPNATVAVLVQNHGFSSVDTAVTLSTIPGLPCAGTPAGCPVRDLWAHTDLGSFTATIPVNALGSHDVAFFRIG